MIAHNVTAFQAGTGNRSIVTRVIEVGAPHPKFDRLEDPAVVRALQEYKDNHDAKHLRKVDDLMKRLPLLGLKPVRPVRELEEDQADIQQVKISAAAPIELLIVKGCDGVQAVDGGTQNVIGVRIIPADYDDTRLLHENPELRRQLIELAVYFGDPGLGDPDKTRAELRKCLTEAIESAVTQAAELATPDNNIQTRRGYLTTIRGGLGVTAGKDNRQHNRIRVFATVGEMDRIPLLLDKEPVDKKLVYREPDDKEPDFSRSPGILTAEIEEVKDRYMYWSLPTKTK